MKKHRWLKRALWGVVSLILFFLILFLLSELPLWKWTEEKCFDFEGCSACYIHYPLGWLSDMRPITSSIVSGERTLKWYAESRILKCLCASFQNSSELEMKITAFVDLASKDPDSGWLKDWPNQSARGATLDYCFLTIRGVK
jgi:hypothetical protein